MLCYIGSADMMPRNLDHRVEILAPVEDPALATQVRDSLERCLADNTSAWELTAGGTWRRRVPATPADKRSAQLPAQLDMHGAARREAFVGEDNQCPAVFHGLDAHGRGQRWHHAPAPRQDRKPKPRSSKMGLSGTRLSVTRVPPQSE